MQRLHELRRRPGLLIRHNEFKSILEFKILENGAETINKPNIRHHSFHTAFVTRGIGKLKNSPVTPNPRPQNLLNTLKIPHTQVTQSLIAKNERPSHNRRNLALGIKRQPTAQLKQLGEIGFRQIGHLVRVFFRGLVHNVRVRRAGGHERVAAHVFVISVVGVFGRMVEGLVGLVVAAHDEVLHVFHAGAFEAVGEGKRGLSVSLCGGEWFEVAYREEMGGCWV